MTEQLDELKHFEIDFKDEDEFKRFVAYMNRTFGHGRKYWSAGSKRYSIKSVLRRRSQNAYFTQMASANPGPRSISYARRAGTVQNRPFPVRVRTDMEPEHIVMLIKLSI